MERLDAREGDAVEFDQVLMVADGADVTLGSPLVDDSRVQGVVTAQGRGKKITVTKFKRRKNYKRIMGHRQHFTEVEITSIGAGTTGAEDSVAEAAASAAEAEANAAEEISVTESEASGAETETNATGTEASGAEAEATTVEAESAAEAESATDADAAEST